MMKKGRDRACRIKPIGFREGDDDIPYHKDKDEALTHGEEDDASVVPPFEEGAGR